MAERIDNLGDKKHKLTAVDQSKGGKKSGQVRRDKRDIKELARAAMSLYLTSGKPSDIKCLEDLKGKDGKKKNISVQEAMVYAQIQRALKGDAVAFKLLIELIAENGGQQQGDLSALYKALDGDDKCE